MRPRQDHRPDALVVLGCKSGRRLRRRVETGAAAFRRGVAPVMLLSGDGVGPEPEAERMRRAALDCGVPAAALLLEPRSNDTFENARYSAALLRRRGWGSVVLVSDRTHLPRAALLFRAAGLRIAGSCGVGAPSLWAAVAALVYEAAAWPQTLLRLILIAREIRRPPRAYGR